MVADAVKIPVVAGGGISDARGVLAALALGADGVYMGTRFMVTHESTSHPQVKEAVVRGEDACTVSVSKGIMLARDLKNRFTEKYQEMMAAGASSQELAALSPSAQYNAQALGDAEGSEICCGQVAGMITEIVSAGEIVQSIIADSEAVLAKLNNLWS